MIKESNIYLSAWDCANKPGLRIVRTSGDKKQSLSWIEWEEEKVQLAVVYGKDDEEMSLEDANWYCENVAGSGAKLKLLSRFFKLLHFC